MIKKIHELGIISNPKFAYSMIVIFFLAYIATGFWLFGLLVGLSIVWVVLLEFVMGASAHGIKNELKETLIALLLALAVWFGSGFLLNTTSPLNTIVSCSMLPNVQRGDLVVLSGDRLLAPQEEISSLADIDEAVVYENSEKIAQLKGSLYSYCAIRQGVPLCNSFIASPERYTERHWQLTFGYGKCKIVNIKSKIEETGPCVKWLEVNGRKYYENLSNDVVVYQPEPDEYYARVGDIIHRAFILLKEKDSGKTYFLTKGDNNPIFDIQVYDEVTKTGNRPVEIERSKGRLLFAVPYIGYFKLFISPAAIPTPIGCDRHFVR